jgi:L-iditol 2-dehydrogenase
MKALMLTAIGEQQLVDVPDPEIDRPEDVLLRVRSVGVCGSDLHGYLGESGRRTPPLIMGHEVTADVEVVGEAVTNVAPGQRVAVLPVTFCGNCLQCNAGRRSLCVNRRVMGMNAPGAYAPFVTWPAANLHPLPESLSYEDGAMAEPLAIAMHAVGLVHFKPYDTVVVVGAGPIGLLTLAVLKASGANCVIVSDVSDERLEIARAAGADHTVNPGRQEPRAVVDEITSGNGVDVAFEAVGLGATAQQTLDVTRNNGTVVWIGNNHRMINIDMQSIVTRELTVLGSYGMTGDEFQRALQILADGRIPTDVLINRRADLEEGPTLFDELLASPTTIKCVINFP